MALGKETDGNQVTTQSSGNHRGSEASKTDSHTSSISPLSVEQATDALWDTMSRWLAAEADDDEVSGDLAAVKLAVRSEQQADIDRLEDNEVELGREITFLKASLTTAQQELERLKALAEKVDAIRNSIIGTQTVNWSAHVYPLVAALGEAGYDGEGYEVAREKAETLIDQRDKAEARAEAAESLLLQTRSERSQETKHDLGGHRPAEGVNDTPAETPREVRGE